MMEKTTKELLEYIGDNDSILFDTNPTLYEKLTPLISDTYSSKENIKISIEEEENTLHVLYYDESIIKKIQIIQTDSFQPLRIESIYEISNIDKIDFDNFTLEQVCFLYGKLVRQTRYLLRLDDDYKMWEETSETLYDHSVHGVVSNSMSIKFLDNIVYSYKGKTYIKYPDHIEHNDGTKVLRLNNDKLIGTETQYPNGNKKYYIRAMCNYHEEIDIDNCNQNISLLKYYWTDTKITSSPFIIITNDHIKVYDEDNIYRINFNRVLTNDEVKNMSVFKDYI